MSKKELLKQNLKEILLFSKSDQVWQMPFFAALGVGIVLSVGMFFNHLDYGLIAMIGVMSFLYVSHSKIYHNMAILMCCSFGIVSSFVIGILSHFLPSFLAFIPIALTALASSILVRYYNIQAPGYFFFVFACILGAFSPFESKDFIFLIGLVFLGTLVANFMAFLYFISTIYLFKNITLNEPVSTYSYTNFKDIFIDSLIISCFVGFAIFLGTFLELERSYWLAISCAIIMQGLSLNSIWIKQFQRIIGTALGILLAYWLLSKHFHSLEFVFLMMFLFFLGQFFVSRNYALAIVFFTPYATYLSEAANFMSQNANTLILARFIDVVIGSILGLLGGFVMYKPTLRVRFSSFANFFLKHLKI